MNIRQILVISCFFFAGCESANSEQKMSEETKYSQEILDIAKRISYEPSAVAEVRALPPSELKLLTDSYLMEVRQSPSYWRLLPARDLIVPYLIAAFEKENPFKNNDESSGLRDSPASRALAFLKLGVHEELKTHLLRWLMKGDEQVFKVIDRHLAAFGSDDLLPDIKILFEHEDMFVSSGARSGALEALKAGRVEPGFQKYLWEHCESLLRSEKPPSMYDPIRLLVVIDEERTKELLFSPEVMRYDHPLLSNALNALNELRSPPEPDFLNSLISSLESAPARRKDRISEAAISGLIIHEHPSAHNHVEKILSEPDGFSEDMLLAAWAARFKLQGLISIYDSAFDSYQRADYELETLSENERHVILMHYLDAEVRNGGFWQWYFNDFGRFGVETRNALNKVGATRHAEIVAKANRLFGWRGPPKTREEVQEALDAMSDKKAQKMDDLNDAWYDLPSWALDFAAWDWKRQKSKSK